MSLDTLSSWRNLLAEIADLGLALCDAVEADDVVAAISTMMQLRRARSALARVDAPARLQCDAAELRALADATGLLGGARHAEAAMQRWLERPLPKDSALLATALGTAALADALLPPVWDFETDLVIVVGAEVAAIGEVLADLGQRRIIALDTTPNPDQVALSRAGVIHLRAVEEIPAALRTLVPNPPAQFVLKAAAGTGELAREVADATRNALSDLRIHRNTVRAFSRTWIAQGTANLPAIARWPSIASVGDAFANVPMVIVAPGPSLKRNSDQLRGLKGRAILTAFSHSLKPVLAAGVVPDLVVTVDPQDVRYHFAGCDLEGVCLVNAATVHPSLFELPASRFLTVSANSAIDDWMFDCLDEDPCAPGGGSVATTAFSLALRWRCDPIVFVGLDLSFPGGEYYVASSTDGETRARVDDDGIVRLDGWSDNFHSMKAAGGPKPGRERAIELPGWHGGSVTSSFMFGLFHRWFVERMASVTDATVYNCTEGGAYIAGMQHHRLADVAFPDTYDVAAILDTIAADRELRAAKLCAHVRGYLAALRRCQKLASRAIRMIARDEHGPRLERIEAALATASAPLKLVSLLTQREVDRAYDVAHRAGTTRDYLAATRSLLTKLDDVITTIEPGLSSAVGLLAPQTSLPRRSPASAVRAIAIPNEPKEDHPSVQ